MFGGFFYITKSLRIRLQRKYKRIYVMRLDKFLQVTGLIKRRTLANEACKRGLVEVNGKEAKATKEIIVNDVIDIHLARRDLSVKVLQEVKGSSLKKSIRHEYVEILKDIAKELNEQDDFWNE